MSSAVAEVSIVAGTSLWRDAWRRMRKNRLAVASGVVLGAMVVAAIVGPWLSRYGYMEQNLSLGARGPSAAHWLGTDALGRDLLTRILCGTRVSLAIGIASALVSLVIGTVYGAIAGYSGGTRDGAMMRFVDVLYALPYLFLVILLVAVFGQNVLLLFIALGAVQWLTTARIVRGQVLSLKEKEFVLAARASGSGAGTIVFRHLIPNALGPVIVSFTLTVPGVILQEAFLSFLGLGVPPPQASLGALVNEGASHMDVYPWTILFPGLTLAALLFSLNFVGDGLRDALDPQMRKG